MMKKENGHLLVFITNKIMKFLFAKNYPLWLIIVLIVIIGYLSIAYIQTINKALNEKQIVIINGKAVTCLPFEIEPKVENK